MKPTPRIELPFWGNVVLALIVTAVLVWCFVDLYRATRRK